MRGAERARLAASDAGETNWTLWGPYLAERAWGTVREDYSADGDAWGSFPFEHARSRVFRWNEDGLAGICDRHQKICLAIALWNGKDSILKERLFGITGPEGNHGEDVKECYYYLDNTPTHSYTHTTPEGYPGLFVSTTSSTPVARRAVPVQRSGEICSRSTMRERSVTSR